MYLFKTEIKSRIGQNLDIQLRVVSCKTWFFQEISMQKHFVNKTKKK